MLYNSSVLHRKNPNLWYFWITLWKTESFKSSQGLKCQNLAISSCLFFRCNTDLGENDLEVMVIRGIQYNLPESKFYMYQAVGEEVFCP